MGFRFLPVLITAVLNLACGVLIPIAFGVFPVPLLSLGGVYLFRLHTILIFREAFVWAVGFTMGFSKVMYPHVSFKQLMDDVGYAQSGDAIIPVSFCILLSSII